MKCYRCSAEIPGQAQFCMRCGTPVGAPAGGGMPMARSIPMAVPQKKKPWAAIIAAILLVLAAGAFLAWKLRDPTARTAQAGTGGPLLDKSLRVNPGRPLTDSTAVKSGPAPSPVDVIDYLKFLKEVERSKRQLAGRQTGDALHMLTDIQGKNLTAEMPGDGGKDPIDQHREDYAAMQKRLNDMSAPWQQLSQRFLQKQPPQSCALLQKLYYDMLGKASGQMAKVQNLFSKAMGGDPSSALSELSSMKSNESDDSDKACELADEELAKVCDKYGIHKDFDIKMESGGNNLLGGLGGVR